MKKLLIGLVLALLWADPALAQSQPPGTKPIQAPAYQPPTTRLSPYEQMRYGTSLWEVPREPYQSRYRVEQETSKINDLPNATISPKRSGKGQSPINTNPAGSVSERRTQERFQSRMQWENEQRKISDRSRNSVPGRKSPGK